MGKKNEKPKLSGARPQTSAETEVEYSGPERPSEARTEAPAHRLCGAETRDQARSATGAGRAIDKVRDEMAKAKGEKLQLLGEGVTAMLQMHPELEEKILAKGKTLSGALEAVRKGAVDGCSDPIRTTKSLCAYYGIPCENPHALALEVTVAMMGGETPSQSPSATALPLTGASREEAPADPFDLDALMGVL